MSVSTHSQSHGEENGPSTIIQRPRNPHRGLKEKRTTTLGKRMTLDDGGHERGRRDDVKQWR
ncbi:hypothetical protein SESBI_20370 [Sesbania bispinosa]|nr:hypothetical protein SESBI_20370 [Sesbania bispinosa]